MWVVTGLIVRIVAQHIMNWDILDSFLIKQSFIILTALQKEYIVQMILLWARILNQNFLKKYILIFDVEELQYWSSELSNHIILQDTDLYTSIPLLAFQQMLKITLVSNRLDEVIHNVNHIAQVLAYINSAQ